MQDKALAVDAGAAGSARCATAGACVTIAQVPIPTAMHVTCIATTRDPLEQTIFVPMMTASPSSAQAHGVQSQSTEMLCRHAEI